MGGATGLFHVAQEQSVAEQANEIDLTILRLLQDGDPAAPARPRELIAIVLAPLLSLSLAPSSLKYSFAFWFNGKIFSNNDLLSGQLRAWQ